MRWRLPRLDIPVKKLQHRTKRGSLRRKLPEVRLRCILHFSSRPSTPKLRIWEFLPLAGNTRQWRTPSAHPPPPCSQQRAVAIPFPCDYRAERAGGGFDSSRPNRLQCSHQARQTRPLSHPMGLAREQMVSRWGQSGRIGSIRSGVQRRSRKGRSANCTPAKVRS